MIEELLDDLRRDEGWRAEPYRDSLSVWTVGYGFVIDPERPWKLPREVGEVWLRYEVERRYEALLERLPWLIEQPEDVKRALTNMSFQLGVRGVLGFKRMLAALQAGERYRAATEALDSRWSEQTPERAQRVARLIRGTWM